MLKSLIESVTKYIPELLIMFLSAGIVFVGVILKDSNLMIYVFVLSVFSLIYYFPSYLAYENKNKYRRAILCLNAFGGFTGLGWVAALVWSQIENSNNSDKVEITSEEKQFVTLIVSVSLVIIIFIMVSFVRLRREIILAENFANLDNIQRQQQIETQFWKDYLDRVQK